MQIIIYGSLYGSTKRYAEHLSEITGIEAVAFKDAKDVAKYDRVIYMGALFAGSVLGLKKTVHGTVTDDMVIGNFGEKMYSIQGFKVGGETGIGLYMFGYWYYVIAFFTYIVMFYFLNSYVRFDSVDKMTIPVPILVIFMRYWTIFLNANGIFSSMGYVFTRAYTNKILIYCVVFFFLRMISKFFVGSQRR